MELEKGSYLYSLVKDFIEEHADFIATGDFDSIFSVANNDPPLFKPALYEFMIKAGIDVEFTEVVPRSTFENWEDSPAEYKVPSGVMRLGDKAFLGSGIEKIELPNSLYEIGDRCFYDAKKLKSIDLPSGLNNLGVSCFSHTNALKEIKFPPIMNIPRAVCNCSNIEKVTLSEGTESIGMRAFRLCNCLTAVKLPKSLANIEADAFSGCTALESIDYAGTMKDWKKIKIDPNAFDSKEALKIKCTDGEVGVIIK